MNLHRGTLCFVLLAVITCSNPWFFSAAQAQVAGFPDAVLVPTDPGPVGDPASVAALAADNQGVLDIFVVYGPRALQIPPQFTYTSHLQWQNPAPNAVMKEWMGNFLLDPPRAEMITNSMEPDSQVDFGEDFLSATVRDRTLSEFPFPAERYHAQISGLQPGELVLFQYQGQGAIVVPEPSTVVLALIGFIGLLACRWHPRFNAA